MATKTKRLRILNEIYDALPAINCKGLCWENCSRILVMPVEELNLELASGKPVPTIHDLGPFGTKLLDPGPTADRCPYLQMRRCAVHRSRPLICRVFGVGEGLPCPHGCLPDKVIPDLEVNDIIARVMKL